jgi:transposase
MNRTPILADPRVLQLKVLVPSPTQIVLIVHTRPPSARCPRCSHPSRRVHSHYVRTVVDLPWQGVAVQLRLHTRRFRCLHPTCPQRIFCERLPGVVAPYGRRTLRLNEALHLLGFALGGEAGARLACQLGMRVSPDTLLRGVRRRFCTMYPTPRVLGVDDWALRKGHHYGTLLVDLERRRPIELLADREAVTLAAWLKTHPGVEIISRDRAPKYAEAAREGAPHAVQVADRWHLLQNMGDTVQRFMTGQQEFVAQAVAQVTASEPWEPTTIHGPVAMLSSRSVKEIQGNRAKRYALYRDVVRLHQQGVSQNSIACTLGINHVTVRRFIRAGTFPERAQYRRGSQLDPYVAYLHQRWAEGGTNPRQLWQELVTQGYRGTPRMVRRYVERLRQPLQALTPEKRLHMLQAKRPFKTPSVRQAGAWLLKNPQDLTPEQEVFITCLCEISADIKVVRGLIHTFQQMIRERQADALPAWLEQAEQCAVPTMRGFAAGLRQDYAAVAAAMEQVWSNGQVEGQITKLKLIKRQMYGRAKLDLLKARLLHAA